MNDKGKGIFYGVVAVATLIVAIVGATLAYFSIMVNSENNAVGLSSDIVSISYSDGQYLINPAAKLIPATNEVVKKLTKELLYLIKIMMRIQQINV